MLVVVAQVGLCHPLDALVKMFTHICFDGKKLEATFIHDKETLDRYEATLCVMKK